MVQLARIFILSFLLWPVVSGADIYRYMDGEGVIHYSNTQPDGKFTLYLREGPNIAPRAPASSIPASSWMNGYVDRFSGRTISHLRSYTPSSRRNRTDSARPSPARGPKV